jgi:hypothetical protein
VRLDDAAQFARAEPPELGDLGQHQRMVRHCRSAVVGAGAWKTEVREAKKNGLSVPSLFLTATP